MDEQPKKPKKLNFRQRRFADELAKTGDPFTAVERSYPNTLTVQSKEVQAKRNLRHPQIMSRVDALLAEKYPDHESDFVRLLQKAKQLAESAEKLTPEVIKLLEFIAKIKGYNAPTQVQKLSATLKLPKE